MAIVHIANAKMTYDTVAQILTITFDETCPPSEPNPAAWVPKIGYQVVLPIPNSTMSYTRAATIPNPASLIKGK